MNQDILQSIIKKKQQSPIPVGIPTERQHPVVPFLQHPRIICEIKRSSPSKGNIALQLDATAQAETYVAAGITSISVLTEEHYFNGSIADLIAVKTAFPHCAILQKDFILSKQDLDIAYRCGADVVLLLASVLQVDSMASLLEHCRRIGLQALIEMHSEAEIRMITPLQPKITGINARDLRTFVVDPLLPLALRKHITWDTRCVFESGVRSAYALRLALHGGFDGILVGEAVVKRPALVSELVNEYSRGRSDQPANARSQTPPKAGLSCTKTTVATPFAPGSCRFWNEIARRSHAYKASGRPLIKICGICRREDALYAMEAGADMLGFIMVSSKRQVNAAFVQSLADLSVLKVAVVELSAGEQDLDPSVIALFEQGYIDAVQLHGDEDPKMCERLFPGYKALRPRTREDLVNLESYPAPRTLLDAYSPHAKGGTGMRIADDILRSLPQGHPLWLAGGITPENVAEILQTYRPECIDVSSGLEKSPAKKSHEKIRRFFDAIRLASGNLPPL